MTTRDYHGTRTALAVDELIAPAASPGTDDHEASAVVLLTASLDEAIWSAELAAGDAPARVYVVEPLGSVAPVPRPPGDKAPRHPAMSLSSGEPLRVIAKSPSGSTTTAHAPTSDPVT
jgi:hypothetical protein